MLNQFRNPLDLLGRVLIALLFLPAGLQKISGFAGTVGYAASVGMPMPQVAVAVGLVIELVAGLAILLGWQTRWAALILGFFTLVASFFFHNFWGVPAQAAMMQQLLFWKNIAVVGGLLGYAAHGAGAWSLDARKS
ncbi:MULTISPECIES: DoxX family protein [Comamonas]|jgi:putative oxidoreductase|uniref:DoxX family protein n=1 Tax=Comamonas TaxID=283 RepID=UPI0012D0449D|nr:MULTISPECIES: DoxX family protein [Comamonas]MDR3064882.1 DoxX family protein [Comamonas sp.]MEB5965322.1 DoxX family protein [Comamonas testosteroni]MPS94544.1 DoxX family protein [Comamonas sp.]